MHSGTTMNYTGECSPGWGKQETTGVQQELVCQPTENWPVSCCLCRARREQEESRTWRDGAALCDRDVCHSESGSSQCADILGTLNISLSVGHMSVRKSKSDPPLNPSPASRKVSLFFIQIVQLKIPGRLCSVTLSPFHHSRRTPWSPMLTARERWGSTRAEGIRLDQQGWCEDSYVEEVLPLYYSVFIEGMEAEYGNLRKM